MSYVCLLCSKGGGEAVVIVLRLSIARLYSMMAATGAAEHHILGFSFHSAVRKGGGGDVVSVYAFRMKS